MFGLSGANNQFIILPAVISVIVAILFSLRFACLPRFVFHWLISTGSNTSWLAEEDFRRTVQGLQLRREDVALVMRLTVVGS